MSELIGVIALVWAVWASGVMFSRWMWLHSFKSELTTEAVMCAVVGSWLCGLTWLFAHFLFRGLRP